jgi:hypothetical protein
MRLHSSTAQKCLPDTMVASAALLLYAKHPTPEGRHRARQAVTCRARARSQHNLLLLVTSCAQLTLCWAAQGRYTPTALAAIRGTA